MGDGVGEGMGEVEGDSVGDAANLAANLEWLILDGKVLHEPGEELQGQCRTLDVRRVGSRPSTHSGIVGIPNGVL